MGELVIYKGGSACSQVSSARSHVCQFASNCWSGVRYNSNNAWYVNFSNGNSNNNNTNNRYYVPLASDSNITDWDEWIMAELQCFKNKHQSKEAVALHYNLPKMLRLAYSVGTKTYKPSTSVCFVITYPTPREVFAANYIDRIVHHYVAPFIEEIAEAVHSKNGDVSHGNRREHSAHTYAVNIQRMLKGAKDSDYVATMDFSGFFMSLDRYKLCSMMHKYAGLYYDKSDKEEKLRILDILLVHNPTNDCEKHSEERLWQLVPSNKSLFCAEQDKGVPIGNFYSQLIANLYRADIDAELLKYCKVQAFVDDICLVGSLGSIREASKALIRKTAEMGLKVHPDKFYIQPVRHGVKTCGRVIFKDRIYISKRVVHNAVVKVKKLSNNVCVESARKVCETINSYHGLMCHCKAYNRQKELVSLVLEHFGKYLYFKSRKGMWVCVIKKKYTCRQVAVNHIKNYKNFIKYEIRKNRKWRIAS